MPVPRVSWIAVNRNLTHTLLTTAFDASTPSHPDSDSFLQQTLTRAICFRADAILRATRGHQNYGNRRRKGREFQEPRPLLLLLMRSG